MRAGRVLGTVVSCRRASVLLSAAEASVFGGAAAVGAEASGLASAVDRNVERGPTEPAFAALEDATVVLGAQGCALVGL